MPKTSLFSEFSKTTSEQWKQKIIDELKGDDFENTLIWNSIEGINVNPFYHSEDLKETRRPSNYKPEWKIIESIFVDDVKKANSKALSALKMGAESIHFIVPQIKLEFSKLIKEIDTKTIPIHFDFQFLDDDSLNRIKKIEETEGSSIYLNLDCIGRLARTGNWFFNEEKDFELLKSLKKYDHHNFLSVDVSLYQNSGANIIQQLAYGLAHANEYFVRNLINATLVFRFSIGANYFFEIAKLRALRWLFNVLVQEYKLPVKCLFVTEPSKRNKTIYNYNTNLLRSATECMSAILGGSDFVGNLPYDSIYQSTTGFSERIARNQLLILKEESYFDKVCNPVDGSYYIESLTQEFAETALKMFKEIENKGGFIELLKKGTIQKEIAVSAQLEQEKFDNNELVLVGSNVFQNSEDKMKNVIGNNLLEEKEFSQSIVKPIVEKRLASSIEQKRLDEE